MNVILSTTQYDVPEKLTSFKTLPIGWHYGLGGPISDDVIEAAAAIYRRFRLVGFSRNDFFAGASGEVLLTAYHRKHYIDVIVEPTKKFSITYEVNDSEKLFREDLEFNEINKEILEIAGKIWNISGSFTPTTMIIPGTSSTIWSLNHHQTGTGYPYSKSIAQKIPA